MSLASMMGTSLKLSDLLILYQQTRQESDSHSFFKHNQSYLQRVNKFHLVWKFNVFMELHYIHICTIWVLIKTNESWVWVSEEWRLRLAGKFMWWSRLHPDTGENNNNQGCADLRERHINKVMRSVFRTQSNVSVLHLWIIYFSLHNKIGTASNW